MNGNFKFQLKKRVLKQMSKNTLKINYASMGEIRTTTHSSIVESNVAKKNKKVVLPFLNDSSNTTINNNELFVVDADD
jgi:hypothetical protein